MTVTRNLLLLVVAMLCFLVVALLGFNVLIHGGHVLGWVGAGLLAFAAAHLP